MSALNDVRAEIAGKLSAAGCEATTDPKCQVPAVLVGAPSVLMAQGVGGWQVEYPINIMGVPPGNEGALEWMLGELETALTVFPGAAFPRTIEHNGADVPAYVLTVNQSVSNPNC